jgi:hypothetical protein
MLRAVGGTLLFPDFLARDPREVALEPARRAGGFAAGLAAVFFLDFVVAEVAAGVPGAPAACRQMPDKETQIKTAASRKTVLLRFIIAPKRHP